MKILSTAFNPTDVLFTSQSNMESDSNSPFWTFQQGKYF